jgi:hypothetical protein
MSEREFSLAGRDFKLCKLDAFKQFHVVRKVGPILADLLPAMKDIGKVKNVESLPSDEQMENVAKVAAPVMTGLSKLSDRDAEFVLCVLLSCVEMKRPEGNWARVARVEDKDNCFLMFQDMELPMLMNLAGRAFMYNLSGFFAGLPQ